MGIKGRRVHMIEELSETIISFQRGNEEPALLAHRLINLSANNQNSIICCSHKR